MERCSWWGETDHVLSMERGRLCALEVLTGLGVESRIEENSVFHSRTESGGGGRRCMKPSCFVSLLKWRRVVIHSVCTLTQ